MSGLCEVLERDNLSIMWHNTLPLIVLDPSDTRIETLLRADLASTGSCFDLFQIPSDSPLPVVLTVASSKAEGGPAAVVGLGCRASAADAAEKAIYECFQVLAWLEFHNDDRPRAIRKFQDHASLYASAYDGKLLRRHLKRGKDVPRLAAELDRPVANDPRAFINAVRQLSASNREVLVTDITTADVQTLGMRVVKVAVPGALEIQGDPRHAQLGADRLYRVPVNLGFLTDRSVPEKLKSSACAASVSRVAFFIPATAKGGQR